MAKVMGAVKRLELTFFLNVDFLIKNAALVAKHCRASVLRFGSMRFDALAAGQDYALRLVLCCVRRLY
ncbi:hypothetical protein HZU75_03980 [Chitinibacter fontanus]|uniref:Uncharacterized protein n=1 Tax=Chitinibacter fontanus TaxID=1737446 RepID=A0A7D5V8N1_9NEIS|nr:hypothetical protein [Chitinibacter fontanus]QLI80758.1 hypothetical protein HZU75_03980 [Chitinibacter fontanus]